MDPIWNQRSSVTRDFSVLSVIIVVIAILTSFWVGVEAFDDQSQKIANDLDEESKRIDSAFDREIVRASYILEALGKQIIQTGTADKQTLAKLLRNFDGGGRYYNVFTWVDADQHMIISSSQGILKNPTNVSTRDYIKQSVIEPFEAHIGQPLKGRISGKLVLPMGYGITDATGAYIGTLALNLDLDHLTQDIRGYMHEEHTGFAILSPDHQIMAIDVIGKETLRASPVISYLNEQSIAPGTSGIINMPGTLARQHAIAFFRYSFHQPFIILTTAINDWSTTKRLLAPRLLQLGLVAAFLVSLLWLVRFRIIYPVQGLVQMTAEIAKGNTKIDLVHQGPLEIIQLGRQLHHILNYINERKRIESELNAKLLGLRSAKDLAEINDQVKMAILRMLKQELLPILNKLAEEVGGDAELEETQQLLPVTSQKKIGRYVHYISRALRELLDFPGNNTQTAYDRRKSIDISSMLHECVSLLSSGIMREEMVVTIHAQQDLPKLTFDELHLMFIVMQVLTLCLHHIPAGGELMIRATLEVHNRESEFSIYFSDNGTGLDISQLNRLWRATETGSKANESERFVELLQAVGLVKKVISLHHGRFTLQNQPDKEAVVGVHFRL